MSRRWSRGFTLVEILIVVLILGILAAVVLPKFSNATAMARASMMADDLRIFRMQTTVFKSQHYDIAAGYPGGVATAAPTEADLVAHMTKATNGRFDVAAPGTAGYDFGPYMREMPENPVNGKRTVLMLPNGATFPSAASDQYGWVYQPSTLQLRADAVGTDEEGRRYFDY